MKTVYTKEVTAKLVADYEAGVALEDMAEALEVTVPSVRSKLVAEKVYVPKVRAVGGASPVRKAHLVRDIVAEVFGDETPNSTLESFEKATKADLEALLSALKGDE